MRISKKRYKGLDDEFDKLKRSRKHRPLEKAWESMLSTFDIHFQQYYTMQLFGKHVHRLLENCEEILEKTRVIMLTNLVVGSDDILIAEIDQMLGQVQELMSSFGFLSSIM